MADVHLTRFRLTRFRLTRFRLTRFRLTRFRLTIGPGVAAALLCACSGGTPSVDEPASSAAPPSVSLDVAPRVVPAPAPPALDAFPTPAGEPKYKRVLSQRLRLSIPLPNRSGWAMQKEKSTFLILEHSASASRLLVGLWREDELMNRERCEERARMLRALPKRGAEVLSSRAVDVPKGFDTMVEVGFTSEGEGAPLDGWALAFGGLARECFAFIFTTTATGDGAERVVGDRLAVMQTLTLEGIERRRGGGVEREKLP